MTNLVERYVAVLMSDDIHTIQVVNIRTLVRYTLDENGYQVPHVDKDKCEKQAIASLRRSNVKVWGEPQMVGILAVADDSLCTGRITWAKLVETQEAVTL